MSIDHQELEIVAACRSPEKLLANYRGEVRVGDLRDPRYLDRVLAGINTICHCAGWTSFTTDEAACTRLYLEPGLDLINRAINWQVTRFINLSTIALAPPGKRDQPQIRGKPHRGAPMFNCMLAVEDYLQAHANERFSVINLRTGIFSGRRLNLGLLRYLLQASPKLPAIGGRYGYLPLVDGRDIGQAFARASLVPLQQNFISLNIVGPVTPTHRDVYRYINEIQGKTQHILTRPLGYAKASNWLKHWLPGFITSSKWPSSLLQLLASPDLDSQLAESCIGYIPQYNWKYSLMESARQLKEAPKTNQYSLRDDGIIFPEES